MPSGVSYELRPIIANEADIIDNRIVDPPLSTCARKLVSDFDRCSLAANNPRVDFRRFSIRPVALGKPLFRLKRL